jgi:hypothetical protein
MAKITIEHLTGADMLRLQGVDPALIAEYEKEMRHINSWRGRLALWWRHHFPPKHWTSICSVCGKRTADKGDASKNRAPICGRPSCRQKYIDAVAVD